MKKTLLILSAFIYAILIPSSVNAQNFGSHYTDTDNLENPSEILNRVNQTPEITSIADILNTLLPSVFIIAGLILFFMLISGGFSIMTATADPQKAEVGKKRITTAITGFVLLFSAYWIAQLLEIVFGITILG